MTTHNLPDSVNTLREAIAQGARFKYTFFWGHTSRDAERVGNECMSQWYPCAFTIEGTEYPTAEHYMMAEKARLFGDDEACARILATRNPGKAKKIGREVRGYDDEAWTHARFEAVVRGNIAKFSQHDTLREVLLGTHQRVLVEASPSDRVWGIGLAANDEKASNPLAWRGDNLLGFALMQVRHTLMTP